LQSVPFLSAAAIAIVLGWAVHSRWPAIRIAAGLLSLLMASAGLLLARTALSSSADDLTRNLAWMLIITPIVTLVALFVGRRAPSDDVA